MKQASVSFQKLKYFVHLIFVNQLQPGSIYARIQTATNYWEYTLCARMCAHIYILIASFCLYIMLLLFGPRAGTESGRDNQLK